MSNNNSLMGNLDIHGNMIMNEYYENLELYDLLYAKALKLISDELKRTGIYVTAIEGRVKSEESLIGKLELKGNKYPSIYNITDIVGIRVIAFYSEDVDKISAIAEKLFNVDWKNTVDKRKAHEINSFGYMSLHYICRLPVTELSADEDPKISDIPFELQMRTALQHVWANMYHDIGYKSNVDVQPELLRSLNRLAGVLDLADAEFSRIRTLVTEYRRLVQNLVQSGKFDDVQLNVDTFKTFLDLKPFERLTKKIAAINQAEIHTSPTTPFLKILKQMGCENLGDVNRLIAEYSDDAYLLALHEIGGTDLDIISSTIAIQDICIAR